MGKLYFLVEDHSLMRQGIVTYLSKHTDLKCVGVAASAQEFMLAMSQGGVEGPPDVLVTDLNIDGSMNGGIQLIQSCHRKFPSIKIVVYSMYAAVSVVSTAIKAGADAYVSKLSNEEELCIAINRVFENKTYIDSSISSQLIDFERSISMFTQREREILNLILAGKQNSVISETLSLNKRSVENYISRIYDKTGFSSKDELIDYYGYKT